jgi:hypothetical protein
VRQARWIRLELSDPLEQWPVGAALSHAQAPDAAPIVMWNRFSVGGRTEFGFAFIVPVQLAPGKSARWPAWALSPALAAYREFGLRAYLEGGDICAHGKRIAAGRIERVNGCAVATANLRACFDETPASERGAAFRAWLREGVGLALTQLGDDALSERSFESALRARIEAQHEWQFENSWPDAAELRAIVAARGARRIAETVT